MSYMHADSAMVSGMAAASLEHFPLSEVQPAVVDSIVRSGPSDALAYFATQHLGWTRSDEDRVVHATTAYLLSVGTRSQSTAAYTLLHFIFDVPNHAWPADAEFTTHTGETVQPADQTKTKGYFNKLLVHGPYSKVKRINFQSDQVLL